MGTIQAKINAIFKEQGGHIPPDHGQFSADRYALMFKPGTYSVEVPLGYYTSVYGLGESPADVLFAGGTGKGVFCEEGDYDYFPGALDNFWRSAENFATASDFAWFTGDEGSGMLWAVSQAAPLRRTLVYSNIILFQYVPPWQWAGMASGGYMAQVKVNGTVNTGSQQQFLSRNSECSKFNNGVWNMVMVGCTGTPAAHCGVVAKTDFPYVVVDKTDIMAEKPFITITTSGMYNLQIPPVKTNTKGVDHSLSGYTTVGFNKVFVAKPGDTASTINAKLQAGLHIVISPGIYHWTEPVVIAQNDQVILCLGLATLVPASGKIVINVPGGMEGVRIAGCLLQAGPQNSPTLLQWGTYGDAGSASNPGVLSDVFARVGGPDKAEMMAQKMIQINSGNVIIDNTWLWRADHDVIGNITNRKNPVETALEVNGDNVHAYGLAVEHTLGDMLIWNGNNGKTFFFQAEYPYDVQASEYIDKIAYKVSSNVTSHEGYGVGVYHYFRDYAVTVATGISCPASLEKNFKSPLGVYLNGKGTMTNIINDKGQATSATSPTSDTGAHPAWYCVNG